MRLKNWLLDSYIDYTCHLACSTCNSTDYGTLLSRNALKKIRVAVTNADTNHSLNLSTIFRYMLLLAHICSSTRSSAACAMNWFKCRWSSFYEHRNKHHNQNSLQLLEKNSQMHQILQIKHGVWLNAYEWSLLSYLCIKIKQLSWFFSEENSLT